ncbi:hypothetical protein [Moorena sp. SIO2C4]|uniref:hypothetical protein n=1 Tax=Moorena sp. SIO2C4 TaxID=2607824 RepID=UPI00257EFBD9|nr:hypothetical protein [Moorena sp. SIO2C4]
MKDYKNNDVVNSYEIVNREEGYTHNRNTEEVLLADLTGIEDPDRIFEGVVDRDTGMGRTLEKLRISKLSGGNVTGGDIYDKLFFLLTQHSQSKIR